MAAASCSAFYGIVPEVLKDDNYEDWSDFLKSYLMGQGLWDVVSSSAVKNEGEDWRMKNAKALHAIKLSCGSDAFAQIKKCVTAQAAWNHLRLSFSSYLGANRDIELGMLDDLVRGNDNMEQLRRHVETGNWDDAKSCIDKDPNVVFSVCSAGRTILHIAVIAGHEDIVENLIHLVEGKEELLKMQDNCGYTALALAAKLADKPRMAECMVDKFKDLLTMKTRDDDEIPVLLAATNGHKGMTRYLHSETPWDNLPQEQEQVLHYGGLLLTQCINAEIFDVALTLLEQYPSIPLTHESQNLRPLYVLAQKPSVFRSCRQIEYWPANFDDNSSDAKELREKEMTYTLVAKILVKLEERISKFGESELKYASAYDAMLLAAKTGIRELVRSMSRANPDLLWATDNNKRGIVSHAILNRRLDLLDELCEIHEGKMRMINLHEDEFGNNILHLAAESAPSFLLYSWSPVLQMKRELDLFKKVERMVHPKCREARNASGKKPHEVFIESHKDLENDCEQWAKGSATSFSLVGTLIITITFAAVFAVPGGFDQQTGKPFLLNKKGFKVFIVADALSLFLSTASVLMFVLILSLSHTDRGFVEHLLFKLWMAVLLLYYSLVSMMIAFCAALALMVSGERDILIALICFAFLPLIVLEIISLNFYPLKFSLLANVLIYKL